MFVVEKSANPMPMVGALLSGNRDDISPAFVLNRNFKMVLLFSLFLLALLAIWKTNQVDKRKFNVNVGILWKDLDKTSKVDPVYNQ